ncbi:MAG TPA: aspartate aminotransferase family protein [Candidatus Acidoferrum sp.]|nr:aspartate aminotransferase family protein [Candidatus Acidoferrum sp.]
MNKNRQWLDVLRDYESRNIVFVERNGSWPIVWERARDVFVWDVNGKKYLDLTAAFGVAAAGHANPRVVRAGQKQMARLLHAMGDVHPSARKAELARELSRITFERWRKPSDTRRPTLAAAGKVIFGNSGFEAVEAALKTAMLATGKQGVVAFTGAYHGLGYGALNATHREFFRGPFHSQLREFGHFVQFPAKSGEVSAIEWIIRRLFRREWIGAILVEPVQGRGGIHVPPKEFLPMLRKICDDLGALLILDEVYTGFGRTGKWFACEHSQVVPDLICLGKALTGGFPLSACVGRADIMDAAWPASRGEAIHTSTYLGHPVGCAMALAQIKEIEKRDLAARSAELGEYLIELLSDLDLPSSILASCRGLGLMAGIELRLADGRPATDVAMRTIKTMLRRGFILLPEGEHGNVISFTPPLTITKKHLTKAVKTLAEVLATEGHR